MCSNDGADVLALDSLVRLACTDSAAAYAHGIFLRLCLIAALDTSCLTQKQIVNFVEQACRLTSSPSCRLEPHYLGLKFKLYYSGHDSLA